MCGIHGVIDLDLQEPLSSEVPDRMGNVTVHRGPDDSGSYVRPGLAIGMRRLSIIDLGGGHQPISNEDKTVWVVCNGEIYNFQRLRGELQKLGHRFETNSDTEVIVHLYEQHGLDFVRHLRGMFGIALWDEKRQLLLLVRDRLGKKPLYVCRAGHRFYFASEMKSILAVADITRRIDLAALEQYLALGYVPAPKTILQGVEKVLPGHLLVVEGGKIEDREYWDVSFNPDDHKSEHDWIEEFRTKFIESVNLRLISDVPLGAFLSGGVDSSAIVAAMSQVTGRPVKTYSIGFAGEDKYYNELPSARLIADRYRTDHHEIVVRPDVASLFSNLVWHLDEPIADSAFITTYLVSRLARESVTVILSGVGGDELFGGYRRYIGDDLRKYYRWLPKPVRTRWIPALLATLPQDRSSGFKNTVRYASAFVQSAELPPTDRYLSYVTVFSQEARRQLLRDDGRASAQDGFLAAYFARCSKADSLHQSMYFDFKTSLPDDLLALTDRMTMAASIECRAPFMDHELVELAGRLPSHFKVHGTTMKYLLKKVLEPWLPPEILHRKKRGFGAPMGAWLRKDLSDLVRDTLSKSQVESRGLFDWRAIEQLILRHQAERGDCTDHLLSLVTLEMWCRVYLDGRSGSDFSPQPNQLAVSR